MISLQFAVGSGATEGSCLALQTFPGQTFPGQDVSRTSHFPDKTFPGQSLSRTDVSQTDVSQTSYTKEFSCT